MAPAWCGNNALAMDTAPMSCGGSTQAMGEVTIGQWRRRRPRTEQRAEEIKGAVGGRRHGTAEIPCGTVTPAVMVAASAQLEQENLGKGLIPTARGLVEWTHMDRLDLVA